MGEKYNLFSGAHGETFVQYILADARKKVLVHRKERAREFIVVAREIRSPRGRSEFFSLFFINPTADCYFIPMVVIRSNNTEPLKVGGENMLKLLRGVSMDTLEQIAEDLRPVTFANIDLVRAVDTILDNRRISLLEEGDTVSMESEE